jgi:hypothetical protein
MSDPERDDEKGFLARWSERKQEARQPEPKPGAPAAEAAVPAKPDGEGVVEEEFDLSSLPKLEDITGTTDITSFLRRGVPEQLRNEALRKSWVLDPAVRNYVNPALEYAYDWNTPGGVPGGGELGAGFDVARMVAQIMGHESPDEAAATTVKEGDASAITPGSPSEHAAVQEEEPQLPTQALRQSDEAISGAEDGISAASQRQESEMYDSVAPQQPVRRHGSAKPTV